MQKVLKFTLKAVQTAVLTVLVILLLFNIYMIASKK